MNQAFRKCKKRIKEKWKWLKGYLPLKYYAGNIRFHFLLSHLFTILLFVIILLLFFQNTGGFESIKNKSFDILAVNGNTTFNLQDIVITQISSTLLILTIVSFLSSIDSIYIYGEKATELLFHKTGVFSLKALFFYLSSMMLINLCLVIRQIYSLWIIAIFLFSIAILIYISLKFATLYINPESIEKKLQLLYLKENDQQVKRTPSLLTNEPRHLTSFFDKTVEYIEIGDLKYRKHISVLSILQNVYLFNNQKRVQDYYIGFGTHSDMIAHTFGLIDYLFKFNRPDDAIRLAEQEFHRLNFNKIVFVFSHEYASFFEHLFAYIENIKESQELTSIQFRIQQIFQSYFLNLYLATKTDFSFCKHVKENTYYPSFHTDDYYLSRWYLSIKNNKYLTTQEKDNLIHHCLLETISWFDSFETGIPFDVEDFKAQRSSLSPKRNHIDPYLIVQPIAHLYLDIFFDVNAKEYALMLKEGLNYRFNSFARILLFLAFETAYIRGEREYIFDISVTKDQLSIAKEILDIENLSLKYVELYQIYREILRYSNKHRYNSGNQTHAYSWNPRFCFDHKNIDDCFALIARTRHIRWPQ